VKYIIQIWFNDHWFNAMWSYERVRAIELQREYEYTGGKVARVKFNQVEVLC
jgi:hypothetical protein